MNTDTVITKGEYRLTIIRDEDPMDPRSDCDCAGEMVLFHKRYKLAGGKQDQNHFSWPYDGETREEVEERMEAEGTIFVPMYLYDHSGLSVRSWSFDCPWDSGWIGWNTMSAATIQKEFGGSEERAYLCLEGEITELNQKLTGDVWRFTLEKATECTGCKQRVFEEEYSCGDFYGYGSLKHELVSMFGKLGFTEADL